MQPFDVFLSHTAQDDHCLAVSLAETLQAELRHESIRCFFDAESSRPGDYIRSVVEHQVGTCRVFVCIISEMYCCRYWCMHELDLAMRRLEANGAFNPPDHRNDQPMVETFTIVPVYLSKELMDTTTASCIRDQLQSTFGTDIRVQEQDLERWCANLQKLQTITAIVGPPGLGDFRKNKVAMRQLRMAVVQSVQTCVGNRRKDEKRRAPILRIAVIVCSVLLTTAAATLGGVLLYLAPTSSSSSHSLNDTTVEIITSSQLPTSAVVVFPTVTPSEAPTPTAAAVPIAVAYPNSASPTAAPTPVPLSRGSKSFDVTHTTDPTKICGFKVCANAGYGPAFVSEVVPGTWFLAPNSLQVHCTHSRGSQNYVAVDYEECVQCIFPVAGGHTVTVVRPTRLHVKSHAKGNDSSLCLGCQGRTSATVTVQWEQIPKSVACEPLLSCHSIPTTTHPC